MRTVIRTTLLGAALVLAVGAAWAQNKADDPKVKPVTGDDKFKDEPGVHRMEIYNGPLRTVHYIYRGLSPSEAQAVRELERAENETTLANELLMLRLQYASGERGLDAERRFSQQQLYGFSESGGVSAAASYAQHVVYPYGYIGTGRGWGGWGWGGYGGGGYSGSVAGGFTSTDAVSLGFGVGDEGRVKTEVAHILAQQATPEYAAKVGQDLSTASIRAASFPVVKNNLGLKDPAIGEAGFGSGHKVVVHLKDGKKLEGEEMASDNPAVWYYLKLKGETEPSKYPVGNIDKVVPAK